MNKKTAIAILIVVSIGLAVALIVVHSQAQKQQADTISTILQFSNDLDKANVSLNDLKQVNLTLNSDLATNREMVATLSNQLQQTSQQLAGAQTTLSADAQQITSLGQHVADLEAQNQVLDQRANNLSNTISQLNIQINETQMQLAEARTNNVQLEGELKKQVAEKEDLQRKFNDLNDVRAQMRKLKTDALIARRLEWIRRGIDPSKMEKGGQILMTHTPAQVAASASAIPNFSLNVEVGADGMVHVLTNAPPPAATSPGQ